MAITRKTVTEFCKKNAAALYVAMTYNGFDYTRTMHKYDDYQPLTDNAQLDRIIGGKEKTVIEPFENDDFFGFEIGIDVRYVVAIKKPAIEVETVVIDALAGLRALANDYRDFESIEQPADVMEEKKRSFAYLVGATQH